MDLLIKLKLTKLHVLMTGAGAPGGAGVLRCLQADKSLFITVADKNENAICRFLNTQGDFWKIPDANSNEFVEETLAYCIANSVNVIFPLVTLELFHLAANKNRFQSHGIRVIVSDWQFLNIANNKSSLLCHLSSHNVLVPDFRVVPSGDFKKLLSSFHELNYTERPLVVKPSISNGSRGVRIIDDKINKYTLLFDQKPNSLYMSYEELISILDGTNFPELLVSEFLPGEEYTIDSILNNGRIEIILPRIRTKISGGISVEGTFVENTEIINYCNSVLTTMNLHGPIGIQVKKAIDGSFKILEINPRIQGTSVAALGAGINLPLIALYQEIPEIQKDLNKTIKWGTSFARCWEEVFY